jgi:hypothetical protein
VSPGNGNVTSGISITYKWNASSGATNYWILISTSSNSSDTSKYKYSNGLGNVIQYTDTGYPNNGTTYYWWVSAYNSGGGWSPSSQVQANGFTFINGAVQPAGSPSAPTLVSPGNGNVTSGISITYKWNASSGATNYWILISTSSDSSDTSKYKYSNGLGNVIQYTDTGYPNNGTTYYWWVSAYNSGGGWSPSSQVQANGFSFINGVVPTPPSAPTLVSPGNGNVTSGTSITYTWNASSGATGYWITTSTSGNSSDTSKYKLTQSVGNVLQYTDTGYPNNGTTYYWWVSAYNSASWSPMSQVLANGCWFANRP